MGKSSQQLGSQAPHQPRQLVMPGAVDKGSVARGASVASNTQIGADSKATPSDPTAQPALAQRSAAAPAVKLDPSSVPVPFGAVLDSLETPKYPLQDVLQRPPIPKATATLPAGPAVLTAAGMRTTSACVRTQRLTAGVHVIGPHLGHDTRPLLHPPPAPSQLNQSAVPQGRRGHTRFPSADSAVLSFGACGTQCEPSRGWSSVDAHVNFENKSIAAYSRPLGGGIRVVTSAAPQAAACTAAAAQAATRKRPASADAALRRKHARDGERPTPLAPAPQASQQHLVLSDVGLRGLQSGAGLPSVRGLITPAPPLAAARAAVSGQQQASAGGRRKDIGIQSTDDGSHEGGGGGGIAKHPSGAPPPPPNVVLVPPQRRRSCVEVALGLRVPQGRRKPLVRCGRQGTSPTPQAASQPSAEAEADDAELEAAALLVKLSCVDAPVGV